jgi:hypothetical protein
MIVGPSALAAHEEVIANIKGQIEVLLAVVTAQRKAGIVAIIPMFSAFLTELALSKRWAATPFQSLKMPSR